MTPEDIKYIRKELGMTQAGLAQTLGLNANNGERTIRKWESGQHTITGPAALALRYMRIYGALK